MRNLSLRFLRRLKAESLKNCCSSSAGQNPALWVLWLYYTILSSTLRYGRTPEPFRENSGTQTWKTRNQLRIVPRMILILKWNLRLSVPSFTWFRPRRCSSHGDRSSRRVFAIVLTRWQEFQKMFPPAPLGLLQENKRRRAPQVSYNFSVRTPMRPLNQTRFRWQFNNWRLTKILPISVSKSKKSSKFPEPLTTTLPTFNGKSKKFVLFEDLFQRKLKIHNQLT